MREDLGNVGPLLADRVEQRMLGDRMASVDVKPDAKQTASARVLRIERRLVEEVPRLAEAVRESRRELGVTPEAIERVVRVGLDEARQAPLRPVTLDRPGDKRPAFAVGQLTGSWARTVIDLPDPLTQVVRPITFDHAVAEDADDVVLGHLNHPLVASCTRLLRAAVWDVGEGRSGLSRVTARVVPDAALGELVVVVHARLVITGRGGHRLHEEIIRAGGRIAAGRFSREGWGVGALEKALEAATDALPPRHVLDALVAGWPSIEQSVHDAVGVRANERAASLERTLDERCQQEVADMRSVLDELRRSIEAELSTLDEPTQLTLGFDQDERQQFDRDVDALRSRVDAIPREMAAEEEEIRRRYATRTARTFPAALTFLVPHRLCEEGVQGVFAAPVRSRSASR